MAPVPGAYASAQTAKQLESTSESGGRGVWRLVLQLCGCIHSPGSQGGRGGVLQIPKQSLADRQTDVESSKRESKVGATTSACLAWTPHSVSGPHLCKAPAERAGKAAAARRRGHQSCRLPGKQAQAASVKPDVT